MRKNKPILYIFSHNVEPNGISGGETILIETFKRIRKYFADITIYTWQPAKKLYEIYGLTNVSYNLSRLPVIPNFYLSFILRTMYGFFLGLTLTLPYPERTYLYFSSDFWPDALPVIFLKLRYPKAIFLSNFYLTAPNPFYGFDEQKKKFHSPTLNGIFFYLMQKPVFWFSRQFADCILVTSQPDMAKFPRLKKNGNYFIVKGGVNVEQIEKFKRSNKRVFKKYEGVFIGRFHPQKGVLELIDIWKYVVQKKKKAHLIMIGDGPLMPEVKEKIEKLHLRQNITLTGYIFDQDKRYEIFLQSKIALHPAIYDSGGMAVAEAMAFGLPAVAFDLLALKTYYPRGMIKVPQGSKKKFAQEIIHLLTNEIYFSRVKKEAVSLVRKEWNWDNRAEQIAQKIFSLKYV